MRILTTGKGTAGSWQCRGVQLGGQIGVVRPKATREQLAGFDIYICVKRINQAWFHNIITSGKLWIWDLVDFYPQPAAGLWSRDYATKWVREQIVINAPRGIIWPNRKMKQDIVGDDGQGIVIYHHHRPDIKINPIRKTIKTVGYEGAPHYLGKWEPIIVRECCRRGWTFVINPRNLADVDVVVAFRDGQFNGYVQRHWKSNVKLANAHGSGTPFIGPREDGYLETASGFEHWVNSPKDLITALDELEPVETRLKIHKEFLKSKITLESCGKQLKQYANQLLS